MNGPTLRRSTNQSGWAVSPVGLGANFEIKGSNAFFEKTMNNRRIQRDLPNAVESGGAAERASQKEIPELTPFVSDCPWCSKGSEHMFFGNGNSGQHIYQCQICRGSTSRCRNFHICNGVLKLSNLPNDACKACEENPRALGPTNESDSIDFLDSVFDQIMHRECEEQHEKWITVRNSLLCWPGPERVNVLRCCELISHKSWITKWLNSSCGNEPQAICSIISHLQWRVSNKVDAIINEVNSSSIV
jgi:hypothetical protein